MEVYTTENEQVDALRRFFTENGKALAVGVVLGIGALVGWRYWQSHQNTSMMEASQSYEQASVALASGKADDVAAAEKFIQANSNSYGVFAALQLAKHFADQGDFAKAEQQLVVAQSHAKDDNLLASVNLRLARVQLQEKKLDEALKTLEGVKGEGWISLMQDVRGDVLLAKGDIAGAREAYSKGIESNASQALAAVMRMKLNNLSS
ncbi:putative negative regulator of RcsB-dependent stress response [Serratia fonticola]|uniref:Ancillary SecYEG translocon subunit n=1 Tax=Serratia fonticola TaxID=47917 RepID=A0A559T816_SERFO|nr:YfgM family protein [Serratia fonticola]TQI81727.1 putative negative regulator of RcsB-dependent stress response [Serratia fonticola]TQI96250.1 putative negative regulator of RcsB-dependent stress response [Serratia fonticola]TVZ70747.1 putative negative regulator of RcsB-dependent stress response [Serratia fonticola]